MWNQFRALSLTLPAALLFSVSANAQPIPGTPYQMERSTITYTPLAAPTVITADVDDGQFPVALPFPVKFYDGMETSISVGANGAIAFPSGTSVSLGNVAPGTTGTPNGFIAPLWDDLRLFSANAGHIGYATIGTAPNRTFRVEWHNISRYFVQGTTMSFSVTFYEGGSGRIDMDYGAIAGGPVLNATMGMEDRMDMRPILFATSGCTANCAATDFQANTRVSVVQDPGIELQAAGIDAPEFGFLGAQTQIPVSVRNLHGNPIGPFTVEVRASTNQDMSNAVLIGNATLSVAPFELRTINVTSVPPQSFGQTSVYLGLTVDSTNVINEVNENNNVAVSPTPMRLIPGLADPAVRRVRTSVRTVNAGDSIDVFTRVQNVGGDPAPSVDVAIMLSTNPVISQQDVTLGMFNVSLMPGQVVNATTSVSIDAATNSGAYYIGALADPADLIMELSEANNGRADDSTLTVVGGALAVATSALPTGAVGVGYNARLSAAGGDPLDRTWEISQGTLPMGIGLVPATGEIFGRPTIEEMQSFTVQITSGGETATAQLTIVISDPSEPLTIVTRNVSVGVVGQEYAFTIVATGGAGTSSKSWSAANLPTGFMLTEQGILAGTPAEASSSTITVSVSDGLESASRDLLLEVRDNANLLIVPKVLSTARFGEAYSEQLEATGGVPPLAWIVQLGNLPPGVTLSPSGAISGTPNGVGTFRFVVEARDVAAGGQGSKDVNTFEIIVVDDDGFVIATPSLPDAFVGQGYDAKIEAMGGLPPYTWRLAEGRIPDGLVASDNQATGAFQIAGQAMATGASNLLVEVKDSQGRTAVRAFSLRVSTAMAVEAPIDEGGCTCVVANAPTSPAWFLLALIPAFFLVRRRR